MTNPVNIIGIGTYFPPQIKKNSDFNYASVGIDDEWVQKAGLNERRYAAPEQNSIDLGYKAAQRAIQHSGVSPDDIGQLIFVTSTLRSDQLVPTGVVSLQQKLGLKNCNSMFLLETCCGALIAMKNAANIIRAGEAKNVLVVAAECFSKTFNPGAEFTFKVGMHMGDGAGAIMLSGDENLENGLLGSYFVSNGDFQGGLVIKYDEVLIENKLKKGAFFGFGSLPPSYKGKFLPPKGAFQEIKKFTTHALPDAIENVLKKTSLSDDDVDMYLLHQPNRTFIDAWREKANIADNKTLDTLDKFGNVSSVSVLVNVDMAYQLGRIKEGDTIVMGALGEGANWGAMAWKWRVKPDAKHNYLIHEEKPSVEKQLKTVENYSMLELWDKFVFPRAKETYTHDELFSDFVPAMAVFDNVPINDAFEFLSKTENLAKWTMSMRNIRPYKNNIYQAEEDASPTGKVFIRTVADPKAKTIEWSASHDNPDDIWMYYNGLLLDAEKPFGRKGTAFFWMNFVHERVKENPMLAMGFRKMFAAHKIEIENLKMVLEDMYGKK